MFLGNDWIVYVHISIYVFIIRIKLWSMPVCWSCRVCQSFVCSSDAPAFVSCRPSFVSRVFLVGCHSSGVFLIALFDNKVPSKSPSSIRPHHQNQNPRICWKDAQTKPKCSPNGVQTDIEIIPKESQEHPKIIRNSSQNHQKKHLKITRKPPQKCPRCISMRPMPGGEILLSHFIRFYVDFMEKEVRLATPFF